MVLAEQFVEIVSELLAIGLSYPRGAAGIYAAGSESVHEVSHSESSLDVVLAVEFSTGIESAATLINDI